MQTGADPRWGPVHPFGPVGVEPWARPANQVKHAPLAALPASEVEVPEGFEVELLYSVPRARQGSWVALCSDGKGALYASDQHGALYRYVLSTGLVERVDVPLGEAQGLAWAWDALYVVVNRAERYESGLYRVTDADGDGRLDRVELLRRFEGNDEHGPHAVVYSWFEDVLYVVGGNESLPPEEALAEWGASYLPVGRLPVAVQEVDVTQFELAEQGLSGWIARTDRDGKEWELVAMGLRNAYDLAISEDNVLYAFDSDMEWDMGLPWYVPTRLVKIVPRADYGFRLGSSRWPTWFPDSVGALADVGRTSPTGMLDTVGLRFPAGYRHTLLAGDWLKGRILAFDPQADGSFGVEVFASGKPLPVTDLAGGPDGALYFTTGGRHAQSGLYRIRFGGDPDKQHGMSFQRLSDWFDLWTASTDQARKALASDSRELQQIGRAGFESRPVDEWIDSIAAERDAGVRGQLELALARVGPPEHVRELLGRLAALPLDTADIEGTLLRLRTLELALLRAEGVSDATRAALAETLLTVFPIGSRDADRQLGVLLASLPAAADAFVPRALEQLAAADAAGDGAEAFHWAFVLRGVERGWTAEGRKQQFEWLSAAERSFGGGRAVPVYLAAMRADALATLTAEERAALGALVEPAADDARAPPNPRPFVHAGTVADLEPRRAEVDGERDRGRGQALLRDAACLACHRIEGRGTALGPELDGLAGLQRGSIQVLSRFTVSWMPAPLTPLRMMMMGKLSRRHCC
jgi:glucose/arabinose dehydrogenase